MDSTHLNLDSCTHPSHQHTAWLRHRPQPVVHTVALAQEFPALGIQSWRGGTLDLKRNKTVFWIILNRSFKGHVLERWCLLWSSVRYSEGLLQYNLFLSHRLLHVSPLQCQLSSARSWRQALITYFSLFSFTLPSPLPPPPPPCPPLPCLCVCVCVCAQAILCVWCARNTINLYFLWFYVYIFVDLVKHGVLTPVSEILHFINDCNCFHHYMTDFVLQWFLTAFVHMKMNRYQPHEQFTDCPQSCQHFPPTAVFGSALLYVPPFFFLVTDLKSTTVFTASLLTSCCPIDRFWPRRMKFLYIYICYMQSVWGISWSGERL